MMKRIEANDPASMCMLASLYFQGQLGLVQDYAKSMELFAKAADLGFTKAHSRLGYLYNLGGDSEKAKSHLEAAAMAGHEMARFNLGMDESNSGNMERAVKHWTISASGGCYQSMHQLRESFEEGYVSRESIDTTLAAYNNSCMEMRSESRDEYIRFVTAFADSLS
jgi:TPR repeat protein